MNTLFDVKDEIRGLLGDPNGQWANDAYLTPLINTKYRLQFLSLATQCGQNLEGIVLLPGLAAPATKWPGIPAGTTSLFQFQAPGQPLAGLYTVLELWSKPAGMPPSYFRRAGQGRFPAHVNPPTQPQAMLGTVQSYYWIGNQLLITPPAVSVDIEVTGRFGPTPLVKDENVLLAHPLMQSVTSCGTAALAGVERTNPAILTGYAQEAEIGLSNIAAVLVLEKQGITQRAGLMDGGSHGQYGFRWR